MSDGKEVTVRKVIGQRPVQASDGRIVFNAPRPLYGAETWRGDVLHGVFYTAVDPADPEAERQIRRNAELDGWVTLWVSKEDVMAWARAYAEQEGLDYSDFNDEQIVVSWQHHNQPFEVSIDVLISSYNVQE